MNATMQCHMAQQTTLGSYPLTRRNILAKELDQNCKAGCKMDFDFVDLHTNPDCFARNARDQLRRYVPTPIMAKGTAPLGGSNTSLKGGQSCSVEVNFTHQVILQAI